MGGEVVRITRESGSPREKSMVWVTYKKYHSKQKYNFLEPKYRAIIIIIIIIIITGHFVVIISL